jgi:phenylacetate-CoA ligase
MTKERIKFKLHQIAIFVAVVVGSIIRRALMRFELAYGLLFLPAFSGYRELMGKWKAWYCFETARRRCPAYAQFIASHPGAVVTLNGWTPDFSRIPAMDKKNYVLVYPIAERCLEGKLPMRGSVIDESSGSTGKPNNWVRGPEERQAVARIMQIALHQMLGGKPIFFLNAFALGPWATGMCVSGAIVDVCLLKNVGPDVNKIINTLRDFGPGYRYVIAGYPPFLKGLVDSTEVEWEKYDLCAFYGGEGITEPMRDYLLKKFKKVYGDYGASDLEINIAAESDFTIAIRRLMEASPSLRKRLNKGKGDKTPTVLQYNPMDYLIEENEEGEVLVTLCRSSNVAPKIKYNIHDLGHVLGYDELLAILREEGVDVSKLPPPLVQLPVLFLYGRSDLSAQFYGCKILPSEIEGILMSMPEIAPSFSSFTLITWEDEKTNKRLTLAVELREGAALPTDIEPLRGTILSKLEACNQDYRESKHMAEKNDALPVLEFYAKGDGPFKDSDIRLKSKYVRTK